MVGGYIATSPAWAHPRRCGADSFTTANACTIGGSSPQVRGRSASPSVWTVMVGSSPQVRGRLRNRQHPHRHLRLIPAGAGQIASGERSIDPRKAHPRRCGADAGPLDGRGFTNGSSPQVRGRCYNLPAKQCSEGLIPAGAGQMLHLWLSRVGEWAHPRRCGADSYPTRHLHNKWGSSPQVRGRLMFRLRLLLLIRLIPAGAGQIAMRGLLRSCSAAHPRRCGADSTVSTRSRTRSGSSPQVRGRLGFCSSCLLQIRLIPAGAGQIEVAMAQSMGKSAHPRRCGADQVLLPVGGGAGGSSPQVRGRLIICDARKSSTRLIPAGAGQITQGIPIRASETAHPRRCGADLGDVTDECQAIGSSPQVRGRCYLSRGDERRFWVLALALFLLVSATVCGSGTCCGLCSSRCAAVGEAVARGGV